MKLTYAGLCIALFSTGLCANGIESTPEASTRPAPPVATGGPPSVAQPPPASTNGLPPYHRALAKPSRDRSRQDEKLIPGSPMHPRPSKPVLPPPPQRP